MAGTLILGVGTPLDLSITDPGAVSWQPGGGLALNTPTVIKSSGPATKVITAAMTKEARKAHLKWRSRKPGVTRPIRARTKISTGSWKTTASYHVKTGLFSSVTKARCTWKAGAATAHD